MATESKMFQKAEKTRAKLRLNINGPSGSGKTWTSLEVARHLVTGGRTALIDTEHGSASKYADIFEFDTVELKPPFHPTSYIEAIKAAGTAGYDVLIIDSLSHGWAGPGGVLELKDDFARQQKYNDYTAWGPAGKLQDKLVEALLNAPMHVIGTMRSKMKYAMEQNASGGRTRTTIRKVGMEPVQRGGITYEFDVVGDMDVENVMVISKTRCSELQGKVFHQPGAKLAKILVNWLKGTKPKPVPTPTPAPPAPPASALANPPSSNGIELPKHLAWLTEIEPNQDREDMEWTDFWQSVVQELGFSHGPHASTALKKALGGHPVDGLNKSQRWVLLARYQEEKAE